MRIHKTFIRCVVAVAAILTPMAAVAADATDETETETDETIISHNGRVYNGDILYKAINNTSTPTPEGGNAETQPEGLLIVDCQYGTRNHRVLKDTAQDVTCAMLRGRTKPFTYSVWIASASGDDTEKYTRETEWAYRPGEKQELTFTGSGKSITFSMACTGTAYADMD